jgi:cell division protein FtsQ
VSGSTDLGTRRTGPSRSNRSTPPKAPIDPRLDQRRQAVRRRHSRRRRAVVVAFGVVVVLGALAWPLAHSRYLSATVVRVVGIDHTTASAVLDASGLAAHPPMIEINGPSVAQRIEALPWVSSARVDLDWPDGVVVTVTERTAVAVVADGSAGWAELDSTGRVLAPVTSAPSGLVRLVSTGLPGAPGTTFGAAEPSLVVAAALPAAFKSMVTGVAPAADRGVDLSLSDGIGVVFGTATQLPSKFEDIASLLAGAGLAPGSVIDVSVPNSPVVTSKSSSPSASSSGSSAG